MSIVRPCLWASSFCLRGCDCEGTGFNLNEGIITVPTVFRGFRLCVLTKCPVVRVSSEQPSGQKKKMFAGYIINNTCFTYVSIMISPVVSSTNIGAVKLVAD